MGCVDSRNGSASNGILSLISRYINSQIENVIKQPLNS